MRSFIRSSVLGIAAWTASAWLPSSALACGGFFCNQSQPVNQAAEGIIFADNGDGTVTAVIQIKYQGPSKNFSWLLPISSVPKSDSDIGVASDIAFQRLQSITNPNYSLTTVTEGTCQTGNFNGSGGASSGGFASAPTASVGDSAGKGVTVEASGVVGSFEWTVISLDKSTTDPADVAVTWLKENGFDVPSIGPDKLGPYLKSGLYLLALKLTKGADTGSIRPIVLTYTGTQASIPVKLTAVAANDDMGVLTWVLGKSRAVPLNYLSLELNEARINWFNYASNYNALVTEAANDAGGQGFVTELAGPTSALAGQIWTPLDESNWRSLTQGLTDTALFQSALRWFGQWDGFWDATRAVVTIPSGQNIDALKACPACYAVQLSTTDYLAQLEKLVIQPVKRVQSLIDNHPEITRLYTTLSADEMTLDPLFGFNPELPNSSNVHTAERVIVCSPNVYMSEAPWHVDLPGGGVVWGADSIGIWPSQLDTLPPTRTISRASESGESKVIEDNSQAIDSALSQYAAPKSPAADAGGGCAASHGGSRGAWVSFAVFGAALLRRRQRLERRRAKA